MRQSDKPAVSIVKCKPYDSLESVKPRVKEALELIGGLESLIMPGDTVLLKPNLVKPFHYSTGATTNPFLIEAVVELAREAHAGRIIIGEGSCVGVNTEDCFEACGINDIANRCNCEVVDFTKDDVEYVVNPFACKIRRIRLPRTFMEANVVINLPVMKTHGAVDVSLGLKNMKGLIQTNDKKRFHKWGLVQGLLDLIAVAMPDLTILDGTVAMEGAGPTFGNPVDLGLLMASKNTVALDRVALEVMGMTLEEVDHIRLAGEAGLGETDLDKIEVLGESIDGVRHPFARNELDHKVLEEYGIEIVAPYACSGCSNSITSYILRRERTNDLEKFRNCILVLGQNPTYLPETKTADKHVIRLGNCTRNLPDYEDFVPGCPPLLYGALDDIVQSDTIEKHNVPCTPRTPLDSNATNQDLASWLSYNYD